MSDTAVSESNPFLLDGDVPRLAQPAPPSLPTMLDYEILAAEPSLSGVGSPGLPAPSIGSAPVLLGLNGPSLPSQSVAPPPAPSGTTALTGPGVADEAGSDPRHPMAHLMPEKSAPSEASAWAAQMRAAKKAKAKRIRIGMIIGFLAVAGLLGPPLGSWLMNAINEAGGVQSEDDAPATTTPATTEPADADAATTVPAADGAGPDGTASDSGTRPTAGLGAAVALPDQARDVVDATNADVTVTTAP